MSSSYSLAGKALTMNSKRRPVAGLHNDRLIWLDIVRLLCALMILGIHWLRACYKVHLFGDPGAPNLVMGYQGQSLGFKMLPHVLIAGTGHSLSVWLTNLIGILGGFGWEGVSALIIVSGFSLTVAVGEKSLAARGWLGWFKRRALRILIPFYFVAIPFLGAYFAALTLLRHAHGALARNLLAEIHGQLQTPLLGVVLSHTLLFNPFARQWQPSFFAPAWWFIPAILLAYAVYPGMLAAVRRFHWMPTLAVSALLSVCAYRLADMNVFMNESWYYIVLQESFNFTLGIVIGHAWLQGQLRARIETILFRKSTFLLACAFFVVGNVANWSPATRPIASILFGPGLVLILIAIAKMLERTPVAVAARSTDAYALYLVHQPFAFPIALAARTALHSYGVFFGWPAFVAIAWLVTRLLGAVQDFVNRRTASAAAKPQPAVAIR